MAFGKRSWSSPAMESHVWARPHSRLYVGQSCPRGAGCCPPGGGRRAAGLAGRPSRAPRPPGPEPSRPDQHGAVGLGRRPGRTEGPRR
eukprot:14041131-Alexandrium_andersonii.AAC.1